MVRSVSADSQLAYCALRVEQSSERRPDRKRSRREPVRSRCTMTSPRPRGAANRLSTLEPPKHTTPPTPTTKTKLMVLDPHEQLKPLRSGLMTA